MPGQTLQPEFVERLQDALRQVSPRTDFGAIAADGRLADLGLDSLSFNELFIVLEDALDLSIDDRELTGVQTFGDLQDVILRLRAAASPPAATPPDA